MHKIGRKMTMPVIGGVKTAGLMKERGIVTERERETENDTTRRETEIETVTEIEKGTATETEKGIGTETENAEEMIAETGGTTAAWGETAMRIQMTEE